MSRCIVFVKGLQLNAEHSHITVGRHTRTNAIHTQTGMLLCGFSFPPPARHPPARQEKEGGAGWPDAQDGC